jgi:hemerythrin
VNACIWSHDYRVNITSIDVQHQKLLSLISSLFHAMRDGKGQEVLEHTLAEVLSYTQTHFHAEEHLMEIYNYPGLAGHKQEHAMLTAHALQERYRTGEVELTVEVAEFLKDWLINHILKSDKQYAPFLLGKGIRTIKHW